MPYSNLSWKAAIALLQPVCMSVMQISLTRIYIERMAPYLFIINLQDVRQRWRCVTAIVHPFFDFRCLHDVAIHFHNWLCDSFFCLSVWCRNADEPFIVTSVSHCVCITMQYSFTDSSLKEFSSSCMIQLNFLKSLFVLQTHVVGTFVRRMCRECTHQNV